MGFADRLQQRFGGGSSFDQRLAERFGAPPEVGVTLEGLDAEAAAAEQSAFKPWSGPEQIPLQPSSSAGEALWGTAGQDYRHAKGYEDEDSTLWERFLEGGRDALTGAAGGAISGLGVNPASAMEALAGAGDQARAQLQMANERSPIAAPVGQAIGEGAIQAAALPAKLLRAPVAAGAVGGGLSGLGSIDPGAIDQSTVPVDPWEARYEALARGAGTGMLAGKAADLLGTGVQRGMQWAGDTAAPWLRQQGLYNRVASSGRTGQGMKELGSRDEIAQLGQFMENEGITAWTPSGVADQAGAVSDKYRGLQQRFVDDVTARETPVYVAADDTAQELQRVANEYDSLASDTAMSTTSIARRKAGDVIAKSQPLTEGYSGAAPLGITPADNAVDAGLGRPGIQEDLARNVWEFPDALRQRQSFDSEVNYYALPFNKQPAHEKVSQAAADSIRGNMVSALEQQAPDMAPAWNQIQSGLGQSLDVLKPSQAKDLSDLGANPLSLTSLAGAAGGGIPGMIAAGAIRTGGRGFAADALGMASRGASRVGNRAQNMPALTGAAGALAGQYQGREQGSLAQSRGFLLPQAAMQDLQNGGVALGPYAAQFAEAANSPDSGAVSALIAKLVQTDEQFRTQVLPQLQLMTAGGF